MMNFDEKLEKLLNVISDDIEKEFETYHDEYLDELIDDINYTYEEDTYNWYAVNKITHYIYSMILSVKNNIKDVDARDDIINNLLQKINNLL